MIIGYVLTVCYTKKIVNAISDGGRGTGKTSEHDCIQRCLQRQPDCVAIDYRRVDGYCYMHNKLTAKPLKWNDCCNRYKIVCDSST